MTEETLFHEALARPTPAERRAFLDAACAGRPELRTAVEALLAAHAKAGPFLDVPVLALQPPGGPARETMAAADSTGAEPPGGAPPGTDLPARIGRYEIRRLLGRGGMGAVYLAHDPELDRPVALKVPRLAGPDAEERFLREARAAAAVTHPNLCPVYDVGRADGVPYLTMAYLAGPTLTEVLRQEGALAPARAAGLAAGVARGMAEAHRHGIVHRDLKPGNILLDGRGEPVVTDFGLALRAQPPRAEGDTGATLHHDPRLTQSGMLVGTPAYMAPEQARGALDRIGPASDVYALGAILFELLTGRLPFPSVPLGEMVRQLEQTPAPLPSALRRGIGPGLDAICRRALAKLPAERFASMDAFAQALAPYAAPGGRGRRWAAAAVALLLALAGAAVLYVQTDHGTIEVRLSEPAADVQVTVDGNEVVLTEARRVTKLRAGPHGLEVKGPDFETETQLFKVIRGQTKVLEVTLRPKTKPAPAPAPTDPAPRPPSRLGGLLARGRQLIAQGRPGELGPLAEEALRLDPDSPTALALRAHARATQGDLRAAGVDAEAALQRNPETPRALFVRAYVNTEAGKFAESIADLTILVRLEPNDAVAWANRAGCYMRLGQFGQGVADASRPIDAGQVEGAAFLNRAMAYAYLGAYAKALADFDRASATGTRFNAELLRWRSAVYARSGDDEKAAADWAAARKLNAYLTERDRTDIPDPPAPPARKKLTAAEARDLERALATFEQRRRVGDVEACLKAAEEACRLDPTSAAARADRAEIWMHTGRHKDALVEAIEALRLDSENPRAYSVRAAGRVNADDLAGGIADASIALRLAPDHATDWNTRGCAYRRRGQYHQALADLTEALRLRPNYELALSNRGHCYLHLGEYAKALADYEAALKVTPKNAEWWLACSLIRAHLGDDNGARRDRERVRQLDPALADQREQPLPTPLPPVKKDPES